MIDPETRKVTAEQKQLQDLVGHEGWKVARQRLADRILGLQNTSEYANLLDAIDPIKLTIAMKADKRATEILYDWLMDIEGTAAQAKEALPSEDKSYIVREK